MSMPILGISDVSCLGPNPVECCLPPVKWARGSKLFAEIWQDSDKATEKSDDPFQHALGRATKPRRGELADV
jgi:hypothetical protein